MLKDGDIVNVDVSTIYNSYFSDSSRMFCIGTVSKEKRRLVDVARECVELGLQEVKPWGFLGDMGQAVHDNAKRHGYSVVREVGGHGVGIRFHEEPFVSYVTKRGTDMLLVPGMIFTIEPMINMGKDAVVLDKANGWTIRTAGNPVSDPWLKEGKIVIQDRSSQQVALMLDPKPNDTVFDACSAPGTKTTQLAAMMNNEGSILACDLHAHRLALVEEAAQRCGATIIQTRTLDAAQADQQLAGRQLTVCCWTCHAAVWGYCGISRKFCCG